MKTWQDAYVKLEIDDKRRLVRQIRTGTPYPDFETLKQSLAALVAQMEHLPRADYVVLQDMRAARGRNDEKFEAVMRDQRQLLSGGFRKVAVLVKSQVGKLQIQRYFDQDELPARAFLDEMEALKWLEAV